MGRIFTVGEALIDFIPVEPKARLSDVEAFVKRPGGAPANVAAAVAKLGGEAYFIGALGDDPFGEFLIETLRSYGVHTAYIKKTGEAKTALAFVTLGENGQRDFSFYRKPSADLLLREEDVGDIVFACEDYLCFGSVDLVDYPVKKTTATLLKKAREAGATVVFDPNIRRDLWDDERLCRRTVREFVKFADILKIADDEMAFITGTSNIEEGLAYLRTLGADNFIITLGSEGSEAFWKNDTVKAGAFKVEAIDTTGAGDGFLGAFLFGLERSGKRFADLDREEMKGLLAFANRAAALVTRKKGAMSAAPTRAEIGETEL